MHLVLHRSFPPQLTAVSCQAILAQWPPTVSPRFYGSWHQSQGVLEMGGGKVGSVTKGNNKVTMKLLGSTYWHRNWYEMITMNRNMLFLLLNDWRSQKQTNYQIHWKNHVGETTLLLISGLKCHPPATYKIRHVWYPNSVDTSAFVSNAEAVRYKKPCLTQHP